MVVSYRGDPQPHTVAIPDGTGVRATLHDLRAEPGVRWANPDPIATASGIPDDPGRSGKRRGWTDDQWNFLTPPPAGKRCTAQAPCGVDAPRAWKLLRREGHPHGRRANGKPGPIVAVVDSGVAYRSRGHKFRRSPDLDGDAFVAGKSFTGHGKLPLDRYGHGTHVASTIAEQTGNGRFVTGLGDGLRVMPVRVLNNRGIGSASNVGRGIRWATRHGAKVINLSLEFPASFNDCHGLKAVCSAISAAHRHGVLVVGAAGNAGLEHAQMPARRGLAVASSTIRGCLSGFSSRGGDVGLTAPGGGPDAADAGSQCAPRDVGPGIVQLTLKENGKHSYRKFGYPRMEGTSMSAAHVSAAAALVLASGVLRKRLGHRPGPGALERWLECTARAPYDATRASLYGAGLLDLGAALNPDSCPDFAD